MIINDVNINKFNGKRTCMLAYFSNMGTDLQQSYNNLCRGIILTNISLTEAKLMFN